MSPPTHKPSGMTRGLNPSVTDPANPLFLLLFLFLVRFSETPRTPHCVKTPGSIRAHDAPSASPVIRCTEHSLTGRITGCRERQPPGACVNSSLGVCRRATGMPPADAHGCLISCVFRHLSEVCLGHLGPERLNSLRTTVIRRRPVERGRVCFPYEETPTFLERHLWTSRF